MFFGFDLFFVCLCFFWLTFFLNVFDVFLVRFWTSWEVFDGFAQGLMLLVTFFVICEALGVGDEP